MTSRVGLTAVVSALLLTVAGCGTDQKAASSPSGTPTTTSTASTSPTSSDVSSGTPTTTSSVATSSPTSSATPTSTSTSVATQTILLNAKAADGGVASGYVQQAPPAEYQDPCMGMSAPSASGFAKGRGVFTCGPTAGSLLACWSFPTLGKIGCIQDSADLHKLTMFTSTISYSGAPEPNPMPLRATLADGTRCNAILHDQAQHWNNRQGWLYCTDGRLLLTGGSDPGGDYFDTSKPTWTADAVPQNAVVAPTKVAVRSVTWAYGA